MRARLLIVLTVVVVVFALATVTFAGNNFFNAHLIGDNEVPGNLSQAQGQAMVRFNKDRTAIEFTLIAANIENINQAHIHNAPAGANGPIVVWLYPDAPPAQLIVGPFQGVLARGTIEPSEILPAGSLAGFPVEARMEKLLEEMAAGRTYVNVHTTGFPGGEIRGQLK